MNVKFQHPVKKHFDIFSIQSPTSYSCKKSNVNILDKPKLMFVILSFTNLGYH